MTKKPSSTKTEQEVAELLGLAERLSAMELPRLDAATKRDIAKTIGLSRPLLVRQYRRVSIGAAVFAVVAGLALLVQSASPGTPLYKVKSGGEDIRGLVQPGFKQELQKRRDQQSQPLPAPAGSSSGNGPREDNSRTGDDNSGRDENRPDESTDDFDERNSNSGSSREDDGEDDQKKSDSDHSGSSRGRDDADKPDDD